MGTVHIYSLYHILPSRLMRPRKMDCLSRQPHACRSPVMPYQSSKKSLAAKGSVSAALQRGSLFLSRRAAADMIDYARQSVQYEQEIKQHLPLAQDSASLKVPSLLQVSGIFVLQKIPIISAVNVPSLHSLDGRNCVLINELGPVFTHKKHGEAVK